MGVIGAAMLNDPELTCASGAAKMFCSFSDMFQIACPESCGLCEEGSPRNPEAYNAVSVFYHAHLLGKEMYTTLIPQDDPGNRIDLRSRSIWTYEDQTPYALDDVKIRPGDKIQTTCVFDSSSRTKPTRFDLATYDEMCLNTVSVMFDTPTVTEEGGLTAANEIYLRGFRCSTSEEGDIWQGEFELDEDPRDVIETHPLKDAQCSWPTGLWIFDGAPTMEKRCDGKIVEENDGICAQETRNLFLDPSITAGYTCRGGLFREKDSNDGTTEEQCTSGGGEWDRYTCGEAQEFIQSSINGLALEEKQYLREYWWAPKCCVGSAEDVDGIDEIMDIEASTAGIMSHGSALIITTGMLMMMNFAAL